MLSIQDLMNEVSAVQANSEQLSASVSATGQELRRQGAVISALVRGSRTGQEAVHALSNAAMALEEASSSMRLLSGTCADCLRNLSK